MKTLEKNVIILSGSPLYREDLGDFLIDFETLRLHRDVYILDFNHDENEIIGKVKNVRVEDGKLVGDATIESVNSGDRADEIIQRLETGTPYELSPTLIIQEDDCDESNGVITYKNVEFRALAVCELGTDKFTQLLKLNTDKNGETMKKMKKLEVNSEIVDEIVDAVETIEETGGTIESEEVVSVEENKYTACPTLEKYIADYGFDLGVELFRRFGDDVEAASAYDYQQLKLQRAKLAENKEDVPADVVAEIAEEAGVEPSDVEEIIASAGESEEDKKDLKCDKKLSLALLRLAASMAKMKRQIKSLSYRGARPVSVGYSAKQDNRSNMKKYADKIGKQIH